MAAASGSYHWIECPHCAAQAQQPIAAVRLNTWVALSCQLCRRLYEVRLTPQAMFEIRQLAPARQAVAS